MEALNRVRTISAGSYARVNIVTEAQSVLPSLTSAFSIDGVHQEQLFGSGHLPDYTRGERNQEFVPSSYQEPNALDDSSYLDTVQSGDSAFSLLRRSLSVPAEYRFGNKSPKPSRPDCRKIFEDFLPSDAVDDTTDNDSIGSESIGQHQAWRQTMADLLEKPDYVDSFDSTSSGAALLAHTARVIAAKSAAKPSGQLSTVTEIVEPRVEKKRFMKNLMVLCISFMFMLMPYISVRNLQSSMNAEGGLGLYVLSSTYISLFIGCIFATTIVQRLRPKPTMLLAMCSNIIYVAANFYPSFYTLIPAGSLLGFSLSNLWTAHATYLTSIAACYAHIGGKNLQHVLSKFNGIFFMFFQIAQILSGVLSSTILMTQPDQDSVSKVLSDPTELYNVNSTFSNSTQIAFVTNESLYTEITNSTENAFDVASSCGASFCHSATSDMAGMDVPRHILYLLLGILIGIAVCGLVVAGIFLDKLEGVMKKSNASVKEQMMAVFRFIIDGRVMCLLPLMFYSLTQISFMFGEFSKAFITCTSGIYMVGYAMMCLSACGAMSAYLNACLQKLVGRTVLICTAAGINMCLLIILLLWKPNETNVPILFVITGIWGLADGIWATQTVSLFGYMFADKKEPAFAGLKMCQSLAVAVSFALSQYMCTSLKIYLMLVLLVLALIGYLALEFALKRRAAYSAKQRQLETPV